MTKTKETVVNEKATDARESESDAKFKRVVIALTVGAVVFLALLVILMCYQLIKIGGERARKAELVAAIAELDERQAAGEETIEIMQKRWWIEKRARQLGYRYSDDN